MNRTGWIYYRGDRAVRVLVLAEVGNTFRVRFPTRKLGLRNRVGPAPKSAVYFTAPHETSSVYDAPRRG